MLIILLYFSNLFILEILSLDHPADLVTNLPGLIFETNFNSYSGYLSADSASTTKMHYW